MLEDDSFNLEFTVPKTISAGSYPIKISVLDDNEDIFENDDNDENYLIVNSAGLVTADGDIDFGIYCVKL